MFHCGQTSNEVMKRVCATAKAHLSAGVTGAPWAQPGLSEGPPPQLHDDLRVLALLALAERRNELFRPHFHFSQEALSKGRVDL